MRYVDNQNITDPKLNLAIEEHLLRNVTSSGLLLFYVNEPAVIIGRNQNTVAEIDPDYIKANQVHVVRRLSGGGSVYHDLGNLNFSFITDNTHHLNDFQKFLEPVVRVLNTLGVPAEMVGKSDILVEGKKVSGNAQFSSRGRMFSHGTILFDTNVEHMLRALNPRQSIIETKAVQSVRQFVTNIKDYIDEELTLEGLKHAFLKEIFGNFDPPTLNLLDKDWEMIQEIRATRYETWDWNYGHSPKFNMQRRIELPRGGWIESHLDVQNGHIKEVTFRGNYQSTVDPDELLSALEGIRHHPDDLRGVLEEIDLYSHFGDIDSNQVLSLLF